MTDFKEHIQERSFSLLGFEDNPEVGWVDYPNEVVTFPLWNLSGQLQGYQAYRWKADKIRNTDDPRLQRYFTRLPKDSVAVYGLQLIPDGYLGPIFLVEGIWEVVYSCVFGIPCIATLGNNPKGLRNWIDSLPNKVYSLTQPDEAGKKLAKFGRNGNIPLRKDLDDCLREGGWLGVPEELYSEEIWSGS